MPATAAPAQPASARRQNACHSRRAARAHTAPHQRRQLHRLRATQQLWPQQQPQVQPEQPRQVPQNPPPPPPQQQEQEQEQRQRRHPSLLRQHDTLRSLLARAQAPDAGSCSSDGGGGSCEASTLLLAHAPTSAGPQQMPGEAEQAEGECQECSQQYGAPMAARQQLQAAVLQHWAATAGDKVPGSDYQHSVALPGLAGEWERALWAGGEAVCVRLSMLK